ncbi:MAG: ATP phosphoribosyltransferase regulatory subunit [Caulobacteraceae bacterium]
MQNLGNPKGMKDILITESSRKAVLQEKLKQYIKSCGFNRIETPLFEYYGLFSGDTASVTEENIIKLIDTEGKVVALRPDITIPAARVVATKLKEYRKPLKLFYSGNVYRRSSKENGAGSEFCQIGAEIYGDTGIWPDIELLSMARECLEEAAVTDYKIDIGDIGIVKGVFEGLSLEEESKAYLEALIHGKNLVELENEVSGLDICDRDKEIICKLPCLFGKPEDVFEGIGQIIVNDTVEKSVNYLYKLCGGLKELGLGPSLIVDAGMTTNIKYYTGLIFKAYAKGTSSVVISGGRYDGLLEAMGYSCPAAGFAVYVDGLIKASMKQTAYEQKDRKLLVIYSGERFAEAYGYAKSCRKNGIAVNLINPGSSFDLLQYKKQYGYDELVSYE